MADNDTAEVRLTAQTDPLKSGVDAAAAAVARAFRSMREAITGLGADSRRTSDQVAADTARIGNAAKSAADAVGGSFAAMGRGTVAVAGVIGGIIATIAMARQGINTMAALKEEVHGLELALGMTSEQATEQAIALRLAGSSAEHYTAMALRVGQQIRTNSEEFERLNVKIRDARGEFLPLDEILRNVYTRMQDFKAGTDQQLFAMTTVGRSAKDFARDMENLGAVTDRAKQIVAELGVEMGPDKQAALESYQVNMRALSIIMEQFSVKVGEQLLPTFVRFTAWLAGPASSALGAFVTLIKAVGTALVVLDATFAVIGSQIGIVLGAITRQFELLGSVLKALATGNLSALATAVKLSLDNVKTLVATGVTDIAQRVMQAKATIDGIWSAPTRSNTPAATKSGGESFILKPKAGAAERDDRLSAWRDELRQLQEAEGYFREYSKAQEAQFWRDKLAMIAGNGEREIRLRREVGRLVFEAEKANAREQLQTQLAQYQRMIDAAENDKDAQIRLAEQRAALVRATYGEESKEYERALDQMLRLRQQWTRREQDLMAVRTRMMQERASFEVELERMTAEQGVATRQISAEQQMAIEANLETRLYTIRRNLLETQRAQLDSRTREYAELTAEIERLEQDHQLKLTQISNAAAKERARMQIEASRAVEDSFGTMLQDLASNTKSLKDALLDMFRSIEREISRLAAQNIGKALFGAGTSGGGFLNSVFGSLFGGLPSFDVGTAYVPRDMVAVVHQGERIVPASENRPGGAGSMIVNQHFAITGAADARSQGQLAAAAAMGLHRARRNI